MQAAAKSTPTTCSIAKTATPLIASNKSHTAATQNKIAVQSASNHHIIVPCLYTKQLLKKRKAWTDGKARISHSKGLYFCTLIDAEDLRCKGLESCQLQSAEVIMLKKRENFVINMENHLVEIDFTQSPQLNTSKQIEENQVSATRLKLPKFVSPSTVAPPPRDANLDAFNASREKQPGVYGRTAGSGTAKRSLDEEIDDLWGETPTHNPTQAPVTHTHQQQVKSNASSLPEYFDTSF
ncbi:DUF2439 domain-containing protein, partial [archaeon]